MRERAGNRLFSMAGPSPSGGACGFKLALPEKRRITERTENPLALYVVAMTGASGAIYGLRIIKELLGRGDDVDLIISPSGFLILKEETGLDLRCGRGGMAGGSVAGGIRSFLEGPQGRGQSGGKSGKGKRQALKGRLNFLSSDDLTASCASGSASVEAMVVCPCSMGTLARIASGASTNLIERAADCALKERRTLVVVPRETPLNTIHLENMLRLNRAGAAIVPAMPAFYHRPATIDDMVDFMAGKVLDMLGLENSLYKRWKT